MHVSCPTHQLKIVKKFLRTLALKRAWPLGVRFKLIDEYYQQMKESNKQKYRYFKDRHNAFMDNLGRADCAQIVNLDKRISLEDNKYTTLRKIILNIKDNKDSHRVFCTVDEKYNTDDMYVVTYRPDKATLASGFLHSLSTYVLHQFPHISFEGSISIEALEQANYESYDPETQIFKTEDDADFDEQLQADLDDDSFDYLNEGNSFANPYAIDESIKLVGTKKMWNLSGDEDTISMMTSSSVSFTNASCVYYDTQTNPSDTTDTTKTNSTLSTNHNIQTMEEVVQESDTEKSVQQESTEENMKEESQSTTIVSDAGASHKGQTESEVSLLKQLSVIQAKLALTRAVATKEQEVLKATEEGS